MAPTSVLTQWPSGVPPRTGFRQRGVFAAIQTAVDADLLAAGVLDLLLAAENTAAWRGYERCKSRDGNAIDAESQGGRMRALWVREPRGFPG